MPSRITRRTQRTFAEFASGFGVVKQIAGAFEAEGFVADPEQPDVGGQRRTVCASFSKRIDLLSDDQQRRLLTVYVDALEDWTRQWRRDNGDVLPGLAMDVVRSLQRDGIPLDDRGQLTGPLPADGVLELSDFHLLRDTGVLGEHLQRMQANIERDTAAVIGAAKELVESVCKLILEDCQVPYAHGADLPDLYKAVAQELRLSRDSVPASVKGSEAAKLVLSGLVNTVQNLAGLRNAMGVGHGRAQRVPALERHARLAMNASRTVAEFLLSTWHERKAPAVSA